MLLGFGSNSWTGPYIEEGEWGELPRSAYGAGWQLGCDVDRVDGPGFFGGETVDCDVWESAGTSEPGLPPNNLGATVLLGIGGYYRRLDLGFRYDAGGPAVIDSAKGPMRVRTLIVVGEWVFGGRR